MASPRDQVAATGTGSSGKQAFPQPTVTLTKIRDGSMHGTPFPFAKLPVASNAGRPAMEALERLEQQPNVAQNLHHFTDEHGRLNVILDLEPRVGLAAYVHACVAAGTWSDGKALRIMADVASGLAFLHANRVWHRGIMPANVLIDGNGVSGHASLLVHSHVPI